ncbi:MAG: phenylalanine--tRNA ligase subunit beta [Holosporaceae bacterium]|jgi:phenylalanyl-tRNA synthetase beta chain|nr:phenylalanine--tRNA ligase subunit beta [Holosporaceae bacterium]
MRFSFNWLKNHLVTKLTLQEVADKLTSIGLEVEEVIDPSLTFKNFSLAQIKDVRKHPGADYLKVCTVTDTCGEEYNIVCGAANVRAGLKTILARPGAVIPISGATLRKSKIRGMVSDGMMCSSEELLLSSKHNGIIELNPDTDLTVSVADALGYDGGILDVSVTPNRGDCFSIRGIARDLAAAEAGEFLDIKIKDCLAAFPFPINVTYENSESYSHYVPMIAFRVIRGVRNGESPRWLVSKLKSAGMNSISAVVDLSNFWMMDQGRPTHIYDLGKINGDVQIRFAGIRETFIDIKGNEHKLLPDMMVAADDESPLCLLGIMGGKKTACTENTVDILIESALFDQIFVSKAGTLLNLTSDSRARFERGIDRDSCVSGLEGLTKLILENCGGAASEVCVVGENQIRDIKICLHRSKLEKVSGGSGDWNTDCQMLKKLGLKEVESGRDASTFSVPSWRSDLEIEEDLIEEVLRLRGYDSIQPECIDIMATGRDRILQKKMKIIEIKRLLISRGLSEVITYSFTKKELAEALGDGKKLIHLINPISVDLNVMRSSLLPNLLASASISQNYGRTNFGIFECGSVFHDDCEQQLRIAGIRLGNSDERNWLSKTRSVDVFDAKGDLFAVLQHCGAEEKVLSTEVPAPFYYHPSRSGTLLYKGKNIGFFGELHPKIGKLFNISGKIICFEILAEQALLLKPEVLLYRGKVFPKINRDFAFVLASKASVGNIVNEIYKLSPLIKKAVVFDCFDLNIRQKSIGITVTLVAEDRTLTEGDAQGISGKIIRYVESVGGELRRNEPDS